MFRKPARCAVHGIVRIRMPKPGKGAVIGTEGSITDAMACKGYAEGTRRIARSGLCRGIVFAYVWRCQQGNKTTFKLSEIKGPRHE